MQNGAIFCNFWRKFIFKNFPSFSLVCPIFTCLGGSRNLGKIDPSPPPPSGGSSSTLRGGGGRGTLWRSARERQFEDITDMTIPGRQAPKARKKLDIKWCNLMHLERGFECINVKMMQNDVIFWVPWWFTQNWWGGQLPQLSPPPWIRHW